MNISFLLECDADSLSVMPASGLLPSDGHCITSTGNDYEFLAWGDPISGDSFGKVCVKPNPEYVVNNLQVITVIFAADNNRGNHRQGSFQHIAGLLLCTNKRVTTGNVLIWESIPVSKPFPPALSQNHCYLIILHNLTD